ncbi:aminotransferase class V-fold PLP-dependent enzyme [Nonomuraea recticatena]|uniref:Aminotransferase class V-fold PLP-dependent enzyme n=1 Tax=Nonomuraea recticatena TaxID=46178 RepID=A0ABN3T9I6_9ACTN
MIDIEKARAETPGCAHVVHLNNAGAALPPRVVLDAVKGHLDLEAHIGGYEARERAAPELDRFYDALAELLGAHRDEIAYVENATRAWDMAFYSVPFKPGDRILTTTSEYVSNGLAYLQMARSRGVSVEVVPDDADGTISLEALEAELGKGGVRLVAINHVPTHNGLVNPAAEVGGLCRQAGVLYLLDACQSVGQLRLNVAELGCDMLSGTGRKFLRGPRGTGFLYVRRSLLAELEPPFIDLHAASWLTPSTFEIRPDARRFENWERYFAGQIGLGVAVDYALALGIDAIEARVRDLGSDLRARLSERPDVTVHDRGARRSGIVTFTVAGQDSEELTNRLRERGVNVSATDPDQRFDSVAPESAVRASVHYYNTGDDLARLIEAL